MPQAIQAMRDAFRALHAGEVDMPVRRHLEGDGGVTLFMPAYIRSSGAFAEKVVSVYAGNRERGLPGVHALVTVFDPTTGAPIALLDGGALTELRTGAVTGLAADLLSPRDARVLTIFGAGAEAPSQIEAVLAVREIEEVRILSRSDSAARLAERLAAADSRRRYSATSAVEDAVRSADIVVTVTTSSEPVFDGAWLRDGSFTAAVGAFRPETREVDTRLVRRSAVVVDQRAAAQEEAGDLIIPASAGDWSWDEMYGELGAIAAGALPPPDLTRPVLFKSCGLAVEDAAAAQAALARAARTGIGGSIEL